MHLIIFVLTERRIQELTNAIRCVTAYNIRFPKAHLSRLSRGFTR